MCLIILGSSFLWHSPGLMGNFNMCNCDLTAPLTWSNDCDVYFIFDKYWSDDSRRQIFSVSNCIIIKRHLAWRGTEAGKRWSVMSEWTHWTQSAIFHCSSWKLDLLISLSCPTKTINSNLRLEGQQRYHTWTESEINRAIESWSSMWNATQYLVLTRSKVQIVSWHLIRNCHYFLGSWTFCILRKKLII